MSKTTWEHARHNTGWAVVVIRFVNDEGGNAKSVVRRLLNSRKKSVVDAYGDNGVHYTISRSTPSDIDVLQEEHKLPSEFSAHLLHDELMALVGRELSAALDAFGISRSRAVVESYTYVGLESYKRDGDEFRRESDDKMVIVEESETPPKEARPWPKPEHRNGECANCGRAWSKHSGVFCKGVDSHNDNYQPHLIWKFDPSEESDEEDEEEEEFEAPDDEDLVCSNCDERWEDHDDDDGTCPGGDDTWEDSGVTRTRPHGDNTCLSCDQPFSKHEDEPGWHCPDGEGGEWDDSGSEHSEIVCPNCKSSSRKGTDFTVKERVTGYKYYDVSHGDGEIIIDTDSGEMDDFDDDGYEITCGNCSYDFGDHHVEVSLTWQ